MSLPIYKIEDVEKEFYKDVDLDELIYEVETEWIPKAVVIPLLDYQHCKKCDNIKHIAKFHRNASYANGFANKCKICVSIEQKERSKIKK